MGRGIWHTLRSAVVLLVVFTGTAIAQQANQEVLGGGPPVDETAETPKVALATIYQGPSIKIDGVLDDAVWRSVP